MTYKTLIQGAWFWEEGPVVPLKVFLPKIGKFAFADSQRHYKGQDKKCYKKKERKVHQKWNGQAFMHSCLYVRAKLLQSCQTLCNPMGCHIPDSSVQGILQARILKWVAISSSRWSSQPRYPTHVFYISFIGWWDLYTSVTCEAFTSYKILK